MGKQYGDKNTNLFVDSLLSAEEFVQSSFLDLFQQSCGNIHMCI